MRSDGGGAHTDRPLLLRGPDVVAAALAAAAPHAALLLIVAVGALLRLYRLGEPSLWLDEAQTVGFAGESWSTLWLTPYDNHPPLYYTIQKFFMLFGSSEWHVRLSSVVFGTLAIPVIHELGRLTAGKGCGLIAAMLLATSPVHVEYSQEARMYALHFFGILVATWGILYHLTRAGAATDPAADLMPRTAAAAYVAGATIALYAHVIAAIFFLVVNALYLAWWIGRLHGRRRFLYQWIALHAVIAALWLPYFWSLVGLLLAGTPGFSWLEHMDLRSALTVLSEVNGQPYLRNLEPAFSGLVLALAVWGAIALRGRPYVAGLLVLVCFAAPVLTWLVGFVKPIYMLRTVLWPVFATHLLVSVGLLALPGRRLAAGLAVAVTALNLVGVLAYHGRYAETEDWRGAAEIIAASRDGPAAAAAVVVLCPRYEIIPLAYYAKGAGVTPRAYGVFRDGVVYESKVDLHPDWSPAADDLAGAAGGGHPAAWVVRTGRCAGAFEEPLARLLAGLGGGRAGAAVVDRHLVGVRLTLYRWGDGG